MTNTTDLRAARGAAREILSLSTAVAFAFGAATALVHADMLDFEDLPPFAQGQGPASTPLGPNYGYHGFRLSAAHAGGSLYHSWYYSYAAESIQDPSWNYNLSGTLWAMQSGEFALRSGQHVNSNASAFSFSRLDGGLFTFDGAWSTRFMTNSASNPALPLNVLGYSGGTLVYISQHSIFHGFRTFLAPPPGLAIDRLDFRTVYQPAVDSDFYLDDFQFTLVPAPSALALFGAFGLFRRRSR